MSQPVLARRRHSIRWRLPLAIGALVYLAMGGMAIFGFLEVRAAVTEVAANRLAQLTSQFHDLLDVNVRQRYTTLGAVANDTSVQNWLLSPRDSLSSAAAARLNAHLRSSGQLRSVELWDTTGTRLVIEGAAAPPMAGSSARALVAEASNSAGSTSPYRAVGDSVEFTTVVPIRRGEQVVAFFARGRDPHLITENNGRGPGLAVDFRFPLYVFRLAPTERQPGGGRVALPGRAAEFRP